MAGNNGSTPRMFLAREIRRGREAKGISRSNLAKLLYVSESLIKQWETGRRVPVPDHMVRLDDLFGMDGMLIRIREQLVKTSIPLEWFGKWTQIEYQATSLWSFELAVVPGLLQTEEYARAILRAANHHADVEEMVGARMERQRVLTREDEEPVMFVALIAESVLGQNIGGPKIMEGQLAYLAEMTERDNVIAQVIPAVAGACAGFSGPFVIASFDSGSDVAYLDNAISGEVVEDMEDLVRLRRMFDVFRADALSQQESRALIIRMAEQWKN